ncbi:AtzG-like protein [Pararhodobacter oceanensis]|uniref:AtzG-like protein n=1 Tax=Pararhodobacter oceanensis TaxID=2172121 RepID=UPI003A8EB218
MRTFLPPPNDLDAVALARSMAPALGLSLTDNDVVEIALNLSRTAGFAALLDRVGQIDEQEVAPVFRANDWSPK